MVVRCAFKFHGTPLVTIPSLFHPSHSHLFVFVTRVENGFDFLFLFLCVIRILVFNVSLRVRPYNTTENGNRTPLWILIDVNIKRFLYYRPLW